MNYKLSSKDSQEIIYMDESLWDKVGGIFASDLIPRNITPGKFYIINTDPSHSQGKHWVSIYFPLNSLPEFFDSFGKCPSLYSYHILESLIEYNPLGFIYNYKQNQNKYSCCCGVYCLYFILARCQNKSFQDLLKNLGMI